MEYPLIINKDDSPDRNVEHETYDGLKTGERTEQKVFGKKMNLVYAKRSADYHTDPHTHTSEQLNYCLRGKVWIFIEDKGYLMEEGDFTRIPENAIHWARGEEENVLLTAHAPPLTATDPEAHGLFLSDEDPTPDEVITNEYTGEYPYDITEEEMMEQFYEAHPKKKP